MSFFLTIAFLFFIGSIAGWGIEVVFRRFFSSANPERKWINPGFLSGPYLPLYGFSLIALYLLAMLERFIPIENTALRKAALFAIMAAAVTLVEYVTGLIFIKGMHVRLWDYSKQWGNIQGIICPKFTLAWALLSAAYYFFVHPRIENALAWLSNNLAFSFIIGFFYGVFVIDLVNSTALIVRIRRFAEEKGVVVKYEQLREHIRQSREMRLEKAKFIMSMGAQGAIGEHLRQYYDSFRDELDKLDRAKADKGKKRGDG